MAGIELVERHVLCVPQVVGYSLQVVGALAYRVLIEPVKAGFVYNVDDSLLGFGDGERRVAGSHLAIGLYAQDGAEVCTLLCIACGVARHGKLS